MTITLNALQKQRRDTASNWTSNNTVLLAGEFGYETDTGKLKIGDGSTAWQSLDYLPIPDTNRLLAGNLTVGGNFTVNGTSTTIDTTTLTVEDKNIEIGKVSSPSDTTADGGGITLKGATDKTINWVDSTDSWTFSEHLDLASGKVLKSAGTQFLSSTQFTGNSATATALATARTIGGVSFDGTANIDLPGVNSAGNQNTTGSAATLTTPRTIAGVSFDGSANISLNNNAITNGAGYIDGSSLNASNLSSGTVPDSRLPSTLPAISGVNLTSLNANNLASGTVPDARLPSSISSDITGNAATATALATARTISGVSFDGTANITLNNSNITNGAGYITATLTNEEVQDIVGNMLSGNTETGITVTYQDSDGTIDFVVASQTDENFTTTLKNKLDGITAGATAVTNNNQISNGANYIAATGGTFTGDVTFDGATAGRDVLFDRSDNKFHFADNAKAVFGEQSDFEIYHDGTSNYLVSGTGLIRIRHSSEDAIITNENGAVEVYYDNSKKFSTESYGVSLHGLTQSTQSYVLYYNSSTGQVTYAASSGGGISSLVEDTSPQLGGELQSNGNDIHMADNDKIIIGTGEDLDIYHSGVHSYIDNDGIGDLFIRSTQANGDVNIRVSNSNGGFTVKSTTDEDMINAVANGAVELFYDNSKKLETASDKILFHAHAKVNADATYDLGASGARWNDLYIANDIDIKDNGKILLGDGDDLEIYHDGSHSYVSDVGTGSLVLTTNGTGIYLQKGTSESFAKFLADGAVELNYDDVKKFETTSSGATVTGTLAATALSCDTNTDISMDNSATGQVQIGGNGYTAAIALDANGMHIYHNSSSRSLIFGINETEVARFNQNGHFIPSSDNTRDLGVSNNRWRNLYTNDLHLSNEGGANDVDGTWGSYTIQEGAEDLFLVNKRNGKKYKFALTEVS